MVRCSTGSRPPSHSTLQWTKIKPNNESIHRASYPVNTTVASLTRVEGHGQQKGERNCRYQIQNHQNQQPNGTNVINHVIEIRHNERHAIDDAANHQVGEKECDIVQVALARRNA